MVKTQVVAITMQDSTVGIMQFVLDDGKDIKREGTYEEIEAEIAKSNLPMVSWERLISLDDIPKDRTFRNAWKVDADNAVVTVDMPKACKIQLDRIREVRNEALSALDVDWSKASAQKDSAKADAVEAKRQKLRDLPQTLEVSFADILTAEDLITASQPYLNPKEV